MNEHNLIPFKQGQSGNPKGKPKGTRSFKTIFCKILESKMSYPKVTGHNKKIPVIEIIAMKTAKDAMEGNHAARETILERTEGKVTQGIDQTTHITQMPIIKVDGKELKFNIGNHA